MKYKVCAISLGIYETFSKKKCRVGLQKDTYPGTDSVSIYSNHMILLTFPSNKMNVSLSK